MPPLTLEKVLLITIVIGLGAAIIANVPAKSVPTFQRSAIDGPTLKGIGNSWKKGPTESETVANSSNRRRFPMLPSTDPFTLPQG